MLDLSGVFGANLKSVSVSVSVSLKEKLRCEVRVSDVHSIFVKTVLRFSIESQRTEIKVTI